MFWVKVKVLKKRISVLLVPFFSPLATSTFLCSREV